MHDEQVANGKGVRVLVKNQPNLRLEQLQSQVRQVVQA
jgi:hypothetical protein